MGDLVGRDGGAAGRRRGAAGHVLGHRGGAPAAVRRLAGGSRLGVGPAARAGHGRDAGCRPARPVRHGRGRRQRPGGAGRAPAPGLGQRRLGGPARPDRQLGRRWPWTAAGLQRDGAGRADRPADGAADGPRRVHRRAALRRAVGGRAADGPGGRGARADLLHRSPAAQRGRGRVAAGRPGRGGACGTLPRASPPTCAARRRSKSLLRPARHGRAGHPGLAAARDAGRSSAGRRAAGLAQGGADRDHLRLRLAGPVPRRRRQAARRVDRLGRRGRPDDGARRACTTCRPRCARLWSPPTGTCSSGPTWARSSRGCWPRCPGDRGPG